MAKFSIKKKGGRSSIVKFKFVVEKLQKKLLLVRNKTSSNFDKSYVPDDVKEGHFAVIAEGGDEPKRLVMPLSCLRNSTFLKLLAQAEEEYGYDHDGALTFPCRPSELERILTQQWHEERGYSQTSGLRWSSSNEYMLLQFKPNDI
ncbi:hypothetical protein TanjilG_11266 [Lupinus angustifolius]|uniref:Uncharacterized protein n=1 Tax=Lupinus angustifolius TaxID=3871 RepID=A0A1J7H8G2_LUPAN|nr:PREDICTED: auxin-responsive protein SAUR50 [Lupinus angustifolius]OIW09128.1 hypothetical protein TanjilG_11266 [Lupinus angustifolius]